MSIDASRWAWQQQITPSQKLVLLSLADRAGEHGDCFPSLSRLVTDTGLYRSTVIDSISALCELGLLSVSKSMGHSNRYTLLGVPDRHEHNTSMEKHTSMEKQTGEKAHHYQYGKPHPTSVEKHTPTSVEKHTHNLPTEPIKETTTTTTDQKPVCSSGSSIFENESESTRAALIFPSCYKASEQMLASAALLKTCGEDAQAVLDVLSAAIQKGEVRKSPAAFLSALVRRFAAGEFDPSPGFEIARQRTAKATEAQREEALKRLHDERLRRYGAKQVQSDGSGQPIAFQRFARFADEMARKGGGA